MVYGKEKFALWLTPEAKEQVDIYYRKNNCKSKSEFIEKAVRFYCGYLYTQQAAEYLPEVLHSMLEGLLDSYGNRMGSMLYKQAIELNIMNHILAADTDMDVATYERLRGLCTREVQASNGKISFKDALKFQKTV